MRRSDNTSAAQLHHANWKLAWVRRACGLIAVLALAHLTYELSFSFQRRATSAPEASNTEPANKPVYKYIDAAFADAPPAGTGSIAEHGTHVPGFACCHCAA